MTIGTQYWDKVVLDMDFANISGPYSGSINTTDTSLPKMSTAAIANRNMGRSIRGAAASVAPNTTRAPAVAYVDYASSSYGNGIRGVGLSTIFTGDFTIEAYVKITTAGTVPIIQFNTPSGGLGAAAMYVDPTFIEISNTGGGSVGISTTLTVGILYKVAIARAGTTYTFYLNNIGIGSVTNAIVLVADSTWFTAAAFAANPGGSATAEISDILITKAAKTTFDPLSNTYLRYAAQITGTITESAPITSWTITGISATGLVATTTTTGSTYTLNCPSLEPYTVTCAPTVNGKWTATTAISTGYFVVATNPNTNPVIYTCTTAGTTSSTEPPFNTNIHTDGTVVWTRVGFLVDPVSLGVKIPS
jgi:hypothetical protein